MKKYFLLNRFCRFLFYVLGTLALLNNALAQPIRVACVGDSITYGYNLTNQAADCYPVQLGLWMGPAYDVRNYGHSGATLLHHGDLPYINQIEYTNALAFKPDIVVIMLGTNDSKHPGDGGPTNGVPNNWQYKTNYISDYNALITEFRRANPAASIYICDPTPCFPGRWGINDGTIHHEIIPLIQQVARDSSVNVIDLYDPFAHRKDLFPDTVHPSDIGAKILAADIYIAVRGKSPPFGHE